MATNDFLPFSTSGTANVYTNAEYVADADHLNGNQPGIAKAKLVNKALRQSSIVSAVVTQYIADITGNNSVDDGTTATLLAGLKNAVSANNTVGTIAALRLTPYVGQQIVSVTGYYTAADNIGVREYYWDALSVEADNGGTIIQVTGIVTGRWKLKYNGTINVRDFGVRGDGTTGDSTILNNVFALGVPCYVPYTSSGYLLDATVTINCNVECDGFFIPTVGIGFNPAIVIAGAGYSDKRILKRLKVQGSVALRTALVCGIRVDSPNAHLTDCQASQLNYGIIVRMYSVILTKCNSFQCNTNLSAYARSTSLEINALTIDGGNYDSAVNCSLNIGDASWADSIAAGQSHGVVINISNGVNTDGAESRFDNIGMLNITGCYGETTNTDCIYRLGGYADGSLVSVNISNNFIKTAKYAVKCVTGVRALTVGKNYLSSITISEVKLSTDIYGITHKKGDYVGCFANGQVVNLAFRSLTATQMSMSNFTLENDNLINGVYDSMMYPVKWYPATRYESALTSSRNYVSSTAAYVFYTTPSTLKPITIASNVITFTNISDCYAFNGGDAITIASGGGAAYLRSIDYDTGIAYSDSLSLVDGATTISQRAPYIVSVTNASAAPTTGTWNKGDICWNTNPAVGSPKGWVCTIAGTSGTWVSMGNL